MRRRIGARPAGWTMVAVAALSACGTSDPAGTPSLPDDGGPADQSTSTACDAGASCSDAAVDGMAGATGSDAGHGGAAGGSSDSGAGGSGDGGVAGASGAATGCPGLPPISGPAERLYVAPYGDDSATGSINAPLRTLAQAASRFPSGGTVIVRGGTYPRQSGIKAAGLPGSPLHIRAADGEMPVFDGSQVQNEWSAIISFASASHVVLEGLEVKGCMASSCQGIACSTAVLDLTLRGCHIHHLDGPAARFKGKQIRIEGNDMHDLALTNENNTDYPNGGWPTCTGTAPDKTNASNPWADDVIIRGNRVRDCWGEGIGLWYASNAIVEDNVVENAWNVGIYADNAFNLRIERNYVHMLRGTNGGAGTGILFGTESYTGIPSSRTHDVVVANNVVVAGGGIGWWAMSTPESTYETLQVFHNTVVATKKGLFGFAKVAAGLASPKGCEVKNNVFSEATGSWLGDPGAFTLSANAWLGKTKPSAAGVSDVTVDIPVGTLAKGTDAQPLASQVGSGEAGIGVAADFVCRARDSSAPTRGAFEE